MYFRVLWSVWIYSLLNWQGRRFQPKRPFLPSTEDQPSESRAMRDRYPLVKKFMSVWVSTGRTWNNFQFESPRMKLPSTAIFRVGVKGKQRPFGLQLCASHGRTFAWHFRCGPIHGENAPHTPFASVVCL